MYLHDDGIDEVDGWRLIDKVEESALKVEKEKIRKYFTSLEDKLILCS